MKYGNLNMSAPDFSEDVAALKDLKAKGEITASEYRRALSALQRDRMMHIVRTNGGYTPSKKAIKVMNKILSMRETKEESEVVRQIKNREDFVQQVQKAQQESEQPSE